MRTSIRIARQLPGVLCTATQVNSLPTVVASPLGCYPCTKVRLKRLHMIRLAIPRVGCRASYGHLHGPGLSLEKRLLFLRPRPGTFYPAQTSSFHLIRIRIVEESIGDMVRVVPHNHRAKNYRRDFTALRAAFRARSKMSTTRHPFPF